MNVRREVLRHVISGRLEVVTDGVIASIEMNCNCLDALPVCRGLCCTSRSGFSVELEPDEADRLLSRPHPTKLGIQILRTSADGLRCIYQDEISGLCSIHKTRPKMCRRWHCSPEGNKEDGEVDTRDAGWSFVPLRSLEAALIRSSDGGK